MKVEPAELLEIQALFVRYSNMIDERQFSRLDEVFVVGAIYDMSDFGIGRHVGFAEITQILLTAPHPLLHVPVNLEAERDEAGVVRAFSRCVAILPNGRVSQCTYRDIVERTDAGWRIRERIILTRTPGNIPAPN